MRDPSPYAGQTVRLRPDAAELGGHPAEIGDWYERLGDKVPWRDNPLDPRAQGYTVRRGLGGLPDDDEVLLARVDGMGQLIHLSEIEGATNIPSAISPPAWWAQRGPKPAARLAVGQKCPACGIGLESDDMVAAAALGPGADPAERAKAKAGQPYRSVVVEMHWACATGDESVTPEV